MISKTFVNVRPLQKLFFNSYNNNNWIFYKYEQIIYKSVDVKFKQVNFFKSVGKFKPYVLVRLTITEIVIVDINNSRGEMKYQIFANL